MRSFQPFRLDETNQCLWRGETRVPVMPKPFAVLKYLVDHAGRLVTQDELLSAIWPDTYVQPEVLRRYILEVRRALGDRAQKPRFIETLPKRGYQFIATVTGEEAGASVETSGPGTRLVGRASVLVSLDGYLRNAVRGQRQIVFVVGEPGIGKTSLVDAFQRAAAAMPDVRVARGQSVEGFGGKEPYYPIFETLGQLARGASRTLVVNTLAANAPTWLAQLPWLVRAEHQMTLAREVLGATRERMVRELCEAFEAMTQTIALVLVLEDLHWVDHSTLDFLSAVARRRGPARLLVLGTFRPADLILSESPLKALKQDLLLHRLCHEVTLECLQESDTAEYLSAEYAPNDFPPGFAAIIHRHSDGNPLFMTAMLDHLVQLEVIAQTSGRWRITVPLERVDPGVPETLKQMLEIQLRHLGDGERQLLKAASVAGLRFPAWAAATILSRDAADVEQKADALAEHQHFLKRSGTRLLPTGTLSPAYEFRHALYRDVLYRWLNPSERVTFHRRLAEGLEAFRSPVDPELAAELALHFEESGEYARAVRYMLVAAQNAGRRYAHREAIEVLEHAQELLPRLGQDERSELDLQILERTGNEYYALGDMTRSADAYEAMATRAAEAGRLAAQADALMRLAHPAESVPFFLRAIELDPNFATAYVSLSRIFSNLGEAERAKTYAKLAYERLEHVGERDRLSITYQYHFEVTGDQARASETLEAWKRQFPREFQPVNGLALIHNFLGRFERAVEEGLEAVSRNPSHGFPYSNLAHAYRGLARFADAQKVAEQAVTRNIETLPTRRLLFQLAILRGDPASAAQHVEWARDRAREFDMVGARAQVAGSLGKVREARQLYAESARMAEVRNLADVGTSHLAWATWMELAYGNVERARDEARRVLARSPSYDPQLRAAMTLAATGSTVEAEAVSSSLSVASPNHTLINSVLAPIVKAAIELARCRPEDAIRELEAVRPYELGFIAALAPIYLRGQACLMLGSGRQAAETFEYILNHRGSDPFSPFYAVAPLGLARALALVGNIEESLEAYRSFLAGWSHADADVPVLIEARHENGRLKAASSDRA